MIYNWDKTIRNQVEKLKKYFSLQKLKDFVSKNYNLFDISSGLDFIEYLNESLNFDELEFYKLTPLTVFDNRLLYIDSRASICLVNMTQASIREIIEELKINLHKNDQIDFRILLLELGKGNIKAEELLADTDWFNDLKKTILNERILMVKKLSYIIKNSDTMKNGIFLLRGATAVGKTTFIRRELLAPLIDKRIDFKKAIISTDEIKKEFVRLTKRISGKEISAYIFHNIASELMHNLLEMAVSSGLCCIIDTRLNQLTDLSSLYKISKKQKSSIFIYDILGDFMTSSLRVLRRNSILYDDPTPDFASLQKSFLHIQNSRRDIIKYVKGCKRITYYQVVPRNSYEYIIEELKRDKRSYTNAKFASNFDPIVYENTCLSNNQTLRQSLNQHANRMYIDTYSQNQYFAKLIHNIHDTSRSINGVMDTSSSSEKKSRLYTGANIESTVAENLQEGFNFIYNNRFLIINPESLSEFIIELANIVNRGIVKGNIFRQDNSRKYNYLQAQYIPGFYKSFIEELVKILSNRTLSVVYIAAFVEWNIDFIGHFFIDGCGRIAKLMSTWVLMRFNHSLPDYSIRQDDFEFIRTSYRKRFSPQESIDYYVPKKNDEWVKFYQYYKTLFLSFVSEPRIVAAGGVIYNEKNEILLLQTSKGKDHGKWLFPGGKLEDGESSEDAFIRECHEETGLIIGEISLMNKRKYTSEGGNEYLFYDFKTKIYNRIVKLNSESLHYKWVTLEDLSFYDLTDSAKSLVWNNLELHNISNHNFSLELTDIEPIDHNLHSMSDRLDDYVCQKLPAKKLINYKHIKSIEIYAIYPDVKILSTIKFDFQIENIIFQSKQKDGNSNSLRPLFCEARRGNSKFIACFVVPGNDLIEHYASMLKYFYRNLNDVEIKVYNNEQMKSNIGVWTGLDQIFKQKNNIVLLGYSTFAKTYLSKHDRFEKIGETQNAFYTSTIFEAKNGKRINCLEANYGHWGDISGYLARNICAYGASEIIHIGKAGTFTGPDDLFSRLYIPNKFFIGKKDSIHKQVEINNNMCYITEHESGGHVSISTVMSETFEQRKKFSKFGIDTIDIESSKIAQAIADFNRVHKTSIKFSSIQFASDYIRKNSQEETIGKVGLTSKRDQLKHLKNNVLSKIMDLIVGHIIFK